MSPLLVELKKRGSRLRGRRRLPSAMKRAIGSGVSRRCPGLEKSLLVELNRGSRHAALLKNHNQLPEIIPLKLGFLIIFNEVHLKDRYYRVVNGLEGQNLFSNFANFATSRASRDTE